MSSKIKALLKTLSGQIPTALVLLGLAALFAWGHQSGWKVPEFSALVSSGVEETGQPSITEYSVTITGMT